jgi:hypothetical protein
VQITTNARTARHSKEAGRDPGQILHAQGYADVLGVNWRTLYNWCDAGMPYVRLGGSAALRSGDGANLDSNALGKARALASWTAIKAFHGVISSPDTAIVIEDAAVTWRSQLCLACFSSREYAHCPPELGGNTNATNGGDNVGDHSVPTEADFGTPTVNGSTIELTYVPTGGRYIFTLVGRGLSLDRPSVVQNHGTSPQWEVEWLARKVAEAFWIVLRPAV